MSTAETTATTATTYDVQIAPDSPITLKAKRPGRSRKRTSTDAPPETPVAVIPDVVPAPPPDPAPSTPPPPPTCGDCHALLTWRDAQYVQHPDFAGKLCKRCHQRRQRDRLAGRYVMVEVEPRTPPAAQAAEAAPAAPEGETVERPAPRAPMVRPLIHTGPNRREVRQRRKRSGPGANELRATPAKQILVNHVTATPPNPQKRQRTRAERRYAARVKAQTAAAVTA